jgi:hypothetical protein
MLIIALNLKHDYKSKSSITVALFLHVVIPLALAIGSYVISFLGLMKDLDATKEKLTVL